MSSQSAILGEKKTGIPRLSANSIKIKDEQKLCYILEHLKLFDENLLDTKEVPSIEDYKNYKAVNNAH